MKCSVITIHHIHNFGSVFQAYALYHFLEQHGWDTEIIDYRPDYYNLGRNKWKTAVGRVLNLRSYMVRKRKFEHFLNQYDTISDQRFTTEEELRAYYSSQSNVFIAGGDQLWNNYHPCGRDPAYKLSFADAGRKMAYGTSMGRDNFSEEELRQLARETKDFRQIVLREKSTVSMLQPYTDVPVCHGIDPVGLLDPKEFEKIAVKPNIQEPYAVIYLADSGELLDRSVELLSQKLGLKIVHICGFLKKCTCDYFEKDVGPEEILGYILHADFVLSASFHATMFSLLFQKQFATLLPGTQVNARIEDVLHYVGLENRILHSIDEVDRIEQKIGYTQVTPKIEKLRQESEEVLLSALSECAKG